MDYSIKNILQVAGIICSSLAFADSSTYSSDDQGTATSSMPSTDITPPAGFAAQQGMGFSLYADFIYYQARQTGLAFAYSQGGDSYQGNYYFPGFSFQPGFTVGGSIDLGHDNWDLDANYTWFNGSGTKTHASLSSAEAMLNPVYDVTSVIDPSDTPLYRADGVWNFVYNVANLQLGRNYYISQYLMLRPYFGISGAWNHQNTLVHYVYGADEELTTGTFDSQNLTQHYWGVGFSTGLNTAWCFDENWSVYANLGIMNLWSRYSGKTKETYYDIADGDIDFLVPTIAQNINSVQYGLQNVVDLGMGLRWYLPFDDNTMGFTIQAGWDQQVWINQNSLNGNVQGGNLSIQGFDLRFKFDF